MGLKWQISLVVTLGGTPTVVGIVPKMEILRCVVRNSWHYLTSHTKTLKTFLRFLNERLHMLKLTD